MSLLSLVARCHPFESHAWISSAPGESLFPAVERSAERGRATLRGGDPRPIHPRRVVTYVLLMVALEFYDPVALVVRVVSRDAPVHECILIA